MRVIFSVECHGKPGQRVEEMIMQNFTQAATYPALGLGVLEISKTYNSSIEKGDESITFHVRIHGDTDETAEQMIMENLRSAATYETIDWGVNTITRRYYHDWVNCRGHASISELQATDGTNTSYADVIKRYWH
jgi:hypothetical protein